MRIPSLFLVGVLSLTPANAHAAAPHKAGLQKVTTVEGITEYALPNGLRVLLFPDPSKPTVTVNATYLVGSRHEGYGEGGMAHLLEHMLFKGSKKHPNILTDLDKRGAKFNGSTSYDRTNYFEILPASTDNLEWALELEADRMVNSKIDGKDLQTEFSVVRNEFEAGENDPFAVLEERMTESAFTWHNYGRPTIGPKSDIERVPVERLRDFYRRYYQPDNAVLVVAGRFDDADALKRIEATLGKVPRPSRVLPSTYTTEPAQDGERTVTLRRNGDVQVVGLMYHVVSGADPAYPAFHALGEILSEQPSGRLYKALVETGLAANVSAGAQSLAEPGFFEVFAQVRAGQPIEPVRDKMIEIVEGVAKGKITDDELKRFKAKALREIELGLTDSERVGIELSESMAAGDWRLLFLHRDRVKALTAADVAKAAADYLKRSNRTVGLFLPEKTSDRAPLPGTPDVKALVANYKGQEGLAQGEAFVASIDNIEKRTQVTSLKNGAKVAFLPKKTRGEAVNLVVKLRVGSERELKGLVQAQQFLSELVFRGTQKHTFQQLTDELNRLKAERRPSGGITVGAADEVSFAFSTVRSSLPEVLSLLAEVLRQPSLPKDQFETLRKERLAELEQALSDPQQAGFLALFGKASPWPKDDVRHVPTVAEEIADLKALKLEQLASLHKTLWGADDAEIVLVGDFDPAAVKAQLDKELGDWKAQKPHQHIDQPYRVGTGGEELIRTPDKQMAMVGVSQPLEVRDDDPDFAALKLADFVFGSGAKSRLFERLRQKEGLSYGAGSVFLSPSLDRGALLAAFAICAPQNAQKAMASLLDEVKKLVSTPLDAKELAEAKKSYQARFDTQLASDDAVVWMLEQNLQAGRTMDYYRKLTAKVQALSATEIAQALKKHIKPESLARVLAGDLK